MLRIGYVRLSDPDHSDAAGALREMGCQVVRVEEDSAADLQPVLASILDFIGEGDELVALKLEHLGRSSCRLLDLVERLDGRGATLSHPEWGSERGPESAIASGIRRRPPQKTDRPSAPQ